MESRFISDIRKSAEEFFASGLYCAESVVLALAKALVAFAEAHAVSLSVQSLFLLITTADAYFPKLGYSPASREDAPLPIKATAQFSDLCPASSSFMCKRLCS